LKPSLESQEGGGIKLFSNCYGQTAAKDLYGFVQQSRQGIGTVSGHPWIVEIAVDGTRGFEGMSAMGNYHMFDDGVHGKNSGALRFGYTYIPKLG